MSNKAAAAGATGTLPTPSSSSISEEELAFNALIISMDIPHADPQVAKALSEYARRFLGDLLVSAKDYANHREHRSITKDDIDIALSLHDSRINMRGARNKSILESQTILNSKPVPPVSEKNCLHRYPNQNNGTEFQSRAYRYVPGFEAYPLREHELTGAVQPPQSSMTATSSVAKLGQATDIVSSAGGAKKIAVKIHTLSLP